MKLKPTILAAAAVLACSPALASKFFVIAPVFVVSMDDISIDLAQKTAPGALVGHPYSFDLKSLLKVEGDPSYDIRNVTWTAVADSLPEGLTFNSNGTITGTPTEAVSGSITAQAAFRTLAGEQTYEIVSHVLTVKLAPVALAKGAAGKAYAVDLKPMLTVAGDASVHSPSNFKSADVSWKLLSGSLPAGLTLSQSGTITGTVTSGTAIQGQSFEVEAQYKGFKGSQTYNIVAETARSLNISPAVSGKSTWNLDSDGPLVLASAGQWVITTSGHFNASVKLWGAGGGGGGYDAHGNEAGVGGGGGFAGGVLAVTPSTMVVTVGGGGGAGGSGTAYGAGGAGYNGGGSGSHAGPSGTSGGGGGGGGLTEITVNSISAACAGGGGGGGGDGATSYIGGEHGNHINVRSGSKNGATPNRRGGDGGGNGGGGGGCPAGGGISNSYPTHESNGYGGSFGGSHAPLLSNAQVINPGVGGAPANSGDGDRGTSGNGGGRQGNGGAGLFVIR